MTPRPPIPPRARTSAVRLLLAALLLLVPASARADVVAAPGASAEAAAYAAHTPLAALLPQQKQAFDDHSPGLALTVPAWDAFVEAMSMSRIHAGAHTRFANEAAEAMGRVVARSARCRAS